MSKSKILVVWSNYYKELADQQLKTCLEILNQSDYNYVIETLSSGTYEIPAVIRYYHLHDPFDGYMPLSLLLQGNTDHYEFIWEHIRQSFTQFALEGLSLGNGIITAPSSMIMHDRVMNGERVKEAFLALDYLIKLKN